MKNMTSISLLLTKEQKIYFEKASRFGGFKTLSDFLIYSAKECADKIMEKHVQILTSEKDQAIFFHALLHPSRSNARLKKAAARYKNQLKE